MKKEELPRLDSSDELRDLILPYCRLKPGEIWEDPVNGHRVGVLDATSKTDAENLLDGNCLDLSVNDPPYNIIVGNKNTKNLSAYNIEDYLNFSKEWISAVASVMAENSHLYIWLGADQTNGFQPLPEFMLLMRDFSEFNSRSFISLRNQRGYGTQKNWMCARQELLYYTKGNPDFEVVYTDIPKVLKGYYKKVNGKITENIERSKSDTIRPGNVWIDIQQVFYRMKENVPGAYAQKPLKAIERIIQTSSADGSAVGDFFSHSGTTLIACELLNRRCYTMDFDPVFAEMSIRRLEHFRKTKEPGWQIKSPFPELDLQRILV